MMYKMSKKKKKESEGDNVTMVLHQDKRGNPPSCKNVKTCYSYGKSGHIAFSFFLLQDKKTTRDIL